MPHTTCVAHQRKQHIRERRERAPPPPRTSATQPNNNHASKSAWKEGKKSAPPRSYCAKAALAQRLFDVVVGDVGFRLLGRRLFGALLCRACRANKNAPTTSKFTKPTTTRHMHDEQRSSTQHRQRAAVQQTTYQLRRAPCSLLRPTATDSARCALRSRLSSRAACFCPATAVDLSSQ